MTAVSARIREIREKAALSQADFGTALGFTSAKISRVERGETEPDNALLVAIREKFGASTDWILTGEEGGGPATFPPGYVPIRAKMQELVDILLSGEISRIAEEEARYGAQRARHIPLHDIEGEQPIPWEGDSVAKTAVMIEAPPGIDDPRAFAGRLADDSMLPEFQQGDVLFFSAAAEIDDGDYACVRIDDKSTFRQVFIVDDVVRLVPANRKYAELRLARGQAKGMFRLVWRMTRC